MFTRKTLLIIIFWYLLKIKIRSVSFAPVIWLSSVTGTSHSHKYAVVSLIQCCCSPLSDTFSNSVCSHDCLFVLITIVHKKHQKYALSYTRKWGDTSIRRVCNLVQGESICGSLVQMSGGKRGCGVIITVFNLAKHTVWIIRSLLLFPHLVLFLQFQLCNLKEIIVILSLISPEHSSFNPRRAFVVCSLFSDLNTLHFPTQSERGSQ